MFFLAESRRTVRVTLAVMSTPIQPSLGGGAALSHERRRAVCVWPEGVGVYAIGNWPAPLASCSLWIDSPRSC